MAEAASQDVGGNAPTVTVANQRSEEYRSGSGKVDAEFVLAPFNPTADDAIHHGLELAQVTQQDTVWEIGCGDARWLIAACKSSGACGFGVEYDSALAARATAAVAQAGLAERVTILCADACTVDFSAATVLLLYLVPKGLAHLQPRLDALHSSPHPVRVVANFFSVPGWEPLRQHKDQRCRLHYYEVGGAEAPSAAAAAAEQSSPCS